MWISAIPEIATIEPDVSLGYIYFVESVKLVKLADTDLLKFVRVVVVYNDSLLIDIDFTVVHFTDPIRPTYSL